MTRGNGDLWFDVDRRALFRTSISDFLYGAYYPNADWDKSGNPVQLLGMLTYNSGSLSAGFGVKYSSVHLGPEGARGWDVQQFNPVDQNDLEGWVFAKYYNGRFFLNAEVDFFNRLRRYKACMQTGLGASDDFFGNSSTWWGPGSGSLVAPQYIESWRWMVELGGVYGPAKLSLLASYLPGPDRRHGILIDRQPTTYPYKPYRYGMPNLNAHLGNAGVFRPYSLLIAYNYGAGVNCTDLKGNGSITDAFILAARWDYALAANLNVVVTFLSAERASHGWQWGAISPMASWSPDYRSSLAFNPYQAFRNLSAATEFSDPIPTVPDRSLGWEITAGADWRLLENWTLGVTAAYWQVGKWFKYACIDRTVPNWSGNPTAANNWGTNPNKSIDPIFGLEMTMNVSF